MRRFYALTLRQNNAQALFALFLTYLLGYDLPFLDISCLLGTIYLSGVYGIIS